MFRKTYFFSFVLFYIYFISINAFAAERVFYEDCEATNFSTWFLERSFGTDDAGYWDILTNSITRSTTDPYEGSYCMTYDPFRVVNPHANQGILTRYGNSSDFDLTQVDTNQYYFRWQHRWEAGIDWVGGSNSKNKMLYLGYSSWGGDFCLTLEHNDNPNRFSLMLRSNPGYNLQFSTGANSPVVIDDNRWHQIEVFIDLGTTGATGTLWVKVDGEYAYNMTNVHFRDQVNINNGSSLGIVQWPSNISGTPSGTAVQWLDNLEIWDGLPDSDTKAIPLPPRVWIE